MPREDQAPEPGELEGAGQLPFAYVGYVACGCGCWRKFKPRGRQRFATRGCKQKAYRDRTAAELGEVGGTVRRREDATARVLRLLVDAARRVVATGIVLPSLEVALDRAVAVLEEDR